MGFKSYMKKLGKKTAEVSSYFILTIVYIVCFPFASLHFKLKKKPVTRKSTWEDYGRGFS